MLIPILVPNIFLSTLISNALSLQSALGATYQVANPYKTTGKVIVVCIVIFSFRRKIGKAEH